MIKMPEIITVAEGTEKHPRHGGVSLIELQDGRLFMAKMEALGSDQKGNDEAPHDIVSIVSRDGGRTWGDYRVLIPRGPGDTAAYHPSLVRLRNGDILLRYAMFHRLMTNEAVCVSAFACISADECKTFSDPVTLFRRSTHLVGSDHDVIQLSTGRIVVPTEYLTGEFCLNDHGMAGCLYSDDDGRTWRECVEYVDLPLRGAEEPKIAELKDGRLLMVMRTQLGSVFQSNSDDGGRTWSKAQTTGLIAPESCSSITRIPRTGDLMIVFNHSLYDPKFDHYGKRTPLSIALSCDEGRMWHPGGDVETDPEWEFTNPATLVTRDEHVLIAYEASKYESLAPPGRLGRSRMHLKLAIIDLEWLYA